MSRGEFFGFAFLAIVVGMLVTSSRSGNSSVSMPLPQLMAEGWLNLEDSSSEGEGNRIPTRENLAGKVVVVDCWATWCPPCRAAMPELAKLYTKYHPLGVEFVGLTSEPASDRSKIETYVHSVDGFDWPVGYGSMPTQDMLGISVLPTVFVFGPDGISLWTSSQLFGIEAVIDEALATVEGKLLLEGTSNNRLRLRRI